MAVDIFIKIEGIKGEAQDASHKEEIDVLAWAWGGSQSGNTHIGGGGGAGKVNYQDLSLTKYVDKSSPTLLQFMTTGKHVPSANLVVRKAGEKPLEYIKLDLKDIIISSVSTGGSGGEDRLTENVTLNFREFKITYTPQNKDGTGGGAVDFGYDIGANEEG
ncbi:MAG: type VI secretion system tube protein Hcp [Pseudomonadota bacterium]